MAASSNPSAVHRTNTSPNGLFGAPLVATTCFFAFSAVPHAKSSLFDFAGAPFPAAFLHYHAMCDTNSSPIHPFGASLVLAIQTPPRYTHLAHPSYLQVFFPVASLVPDVLPSDLSPSSLGGLIFQKLPKEQFLVQEPEILIDGHPMCDTRSSPNRPSDASLMLTSVLFLPP